MANNTSMKSESTHGKSTRRQIKHSLSKLQKHDSYINERGKEDMSLNCSIKAKVLLHWDRKTTHKKWH